MECSPPAAAPCAACLLQTSDILKHSCLPFVVTINPLALPEPNDDPIEVGQSRCALWLPGGVRRAAGIWEVSCQTICRDTKGEQLCIAC